MDATDRRLLDKLQESFPLVPRPFAALGRALALSEDDVLVRTSQLKDRGIIREIGPIFSSRHLGYQSTLAAFRVSVERLDEVASIVSQHPGVSHNYSRNHDYNLWFTLTVPPDRDLEDEIARLARAGSVEDYLNLPSVRLFKLGVHFEMSRRGSKRASVPAHRGRDEARHDQEGAGTKDRLKGTIDPVTDFERDVVRVLQGDLPMVPRPYQGAASALNVTEETLLEVARDLDARGIMRRNSAVLKHRRAGFTANGMACWVVPDERIVEAGEAAAGFAAVSHCYQRPAYPPRWPYNLFTMVHGRTPDEVQTTVDSIHKLVRPVEYTTLYSQKEYKKQRVRYFVQWPA